MRAQLTLVQMRMPKEQAVAVKQRCAQHGLAMSEWLRRLIDRELKEDELARLRHEVVRLTKENRLQAEVIELRRKVK